MFHHVKIIENSNDIMGLGLGDMYQYTPVMSISDIEFWDDRLNYLDIPYVLAEVETTEAEPTRYCRGYALFIRKEDYND